MQASYIILVKQLLLPQGKVASCQITQAACPCSETYISFHPGFGSAIRRRPMLTRGIPLLELVDTLR